MSDDGFLAGVYRTGTVLWLLGLLILAVFRAWPGLAGWTVGCAVSFGLVRSLEVVIRRSFVPGAHKAKRDLANASLVKLPIVVLILSGLVLIAGRSFAVIGGFCAGLIVVQTAMVVNTLRSLVGDKPSTR